MPTAYKLAFLCEEDTSFVKSMPGAFVLRSILGYNLRSMCCIAHGNECSSCPYNKTCAYAYIFETIISPNNQIAPGTNRATHPFCFSDCATSSFTMTLFGNACAYLPYIYAAFYRAGKRGLFKERIPYSIVDVTVGSESILIDKENIYTGSIPFELKYDFAPKDRTSGLPEKRRGEILVELISPLRFKIRGKYSIDFTARDFMQCLFRRVKTLCSLYGDFSDVPFYDLDAIEFEITKKELFWKDYKHYSARQKTAMDLGGVCGAFKLAGKFSDFDFFLLDFARTCNAGKNPNFGLGQIDFWTKEQ